MCIERYKFLVWTKFLKLTLSNDGCVQGEQKNEISLIGHGVECKEGIANPLSQV
jgi:hypothetical protein